MSCTARLVGIAGIALLTLACAPDEAEQNKETVRRMTEAMNSRDFDALDELIAPDVRRHSSATPGIKVENLEQFKEFLRQDLAAVPDAQQEIHFLLAEDDLVAGFISYRGTQTGQFGPYPPSDRKVDAPFIGILRLHEGKIAEIWVEWDNLNMLTQLGHFPPPAPADTGADPEE